MSVIDRIREYSEPGDYLRSVIEFLLGAGFLALAVALQLRIVTIDPQSPHLHLWMIFELAAAFIMGLAHFLTWDDERAPLWSRLIFVACFSVYILWILRFAWFVVLPLLAVKALSLRLHGTLTEEQFAFRTLKGMYIIASLVLGLLAYAVFDMTGVWPDRGEPDTPLAVLLGLYYIGLGVWQAVLEAVKRMPSSQAA